MGPSSEHGDLWDCTGHTAVQSTLYSLSLANLNNLVPPNPDCAGLCVISRLWKQWGNNSQRAFYCQNRNTATVQSCPSLLTIVTSVSMFLEHLKLTLPLGPLLLTARFPGLLLPRDCGDSLLPFIQNSAQMSPCPEAFPS